MSPQHFCLTMSQTGDIAYEKLSVQRCCYRCVVGARGCGDMPARPYIPAVAAPVYNWGGFYGGVNAGGAWGPMHWQSTSFSRKHIAAGQRRLRRFSGRLQFSDPFVRAGHRRRLRVRQYQRDQPLPQSDFHLPLQVAQYRRHRGPPRLCLGPGAVLCKGGEAWAFNRYESLPPPTPLAAPRRAPDGSAASASNMPTIRAGR